MPPFCSDKALPILQAPSSRKRKASSRFIENTDLLLPKNKKSKRSIKRKPAQQDTNASTHPSPPTQKSFVEGAGDDSDSSSIAPGLRSPSMHSESIDPGISNGDEVSTIMEVDNEESEESARSKESAESKLSKPLPHAIYHH